MPFIPSPAAPANTLSSSLPSLYATPSRALSVPEPTRVVVDFTTLLTISDFSTFYPGVSPDLFQPIYYAVADGSLVAPPFREDLIINNVFLILTGCLLSIFIRNVCKAALFLCRGKVKKKGLLYTLFFSQLFGPIAIIAIIVAQFGRSADCTAILRVFSIASGVSLSLLVTGIFGVKAWRCLDNNRLVSAVLVPLRAAGSVVLILDAVRMQAIRSLSGRCRRLSAGLPSIFLALLLAESLFICACFLYAVLKSRRPVAVRGRISVHLSLDEVQPRNQTPDSIQNRKRQSDVRPHPKRFSTSWEPSSLSREPSITSIPHDVFQWRYSHDMPVSEPTHNPKHPIPFPSTVHSHPPVSRSWTTRIPTTADGSHLPESVVSPSAHSPISRFTRYIPRMSLFREAMRYEFFYTAITAAFTAISVAMIAGVRSAGGIGSSVWVSFDWALVSLLAVHSFGRAIRRHENESLLLHPSARYHDLHTDRTTAELLGDASQSVRGPGMLSRARTRRSTARHYPDGGAPPSGLSARRLFSGSAHSSRFDLHSLAASTSGTSNVFHHSSRDLGEREDPSSMQVVEEWFNKHLFGVPPLPKPPDEGHSCDDVS